MPEPRSTADLLAGWRSEAIDSGMVDPEDFAAHPPTAPERLADLERRLGRSLPPSYREFLSYADGWPVGGEFVAGLRNASRVGWFRDVEREWYEIWRDIDGPDNPVSHDVQLMARALVVSEPGTEALLLDPGTVDAATGEWACCRFSNWAPGATPVGASFRAGLDHVFGSFRDRLSDAVVAQDRTRQVVESAYRALLAGDLSARARLDGALPADWRATLLAIQYDTFGAAPFQPDLSADIEDLWVDAEDDDATMAALSDPVVTEELVPLHVVRSAERSAAMRGLSGEAPRVPGRIAERLRTLSAQVDAGTGPVADFSYSPRFAAAVETARRQITDGNLDEAWATVLDALPTWTPRSAHHVAPVGLYYDKDLRRLLTPLPSDQATRSTRPPVGMVGRALLLWSGAVASPVASDAVVALPSRKQHSDRTLAVLRVPFGSGV